jgi:hypothetical protein
MRRYDIYDSNRVEFDFNIAIYFSWTIKRTQKDQHLAAQEHHFLGNKLGKRVLM